MPTVMKMSKHVRKIGKAVNNIENKLDATITVY